MKNIPVRRLLAVALLALAAGCNPPKYTVYESLNNDYSVSVPWGWQVVTDQQDNDFTQAAFIGPFDPDFYLGAPSLSVRWYRRYTAHRLVDGRLEIYSGADDFIRQTLKTVYGPEYILETLDGKPSYDNARKTEIIPEIVLKTSGLKAKGFSVESATPAPGANRWGISAQAGTDKPYVLRKHAYVVMNVADGFYVITYPATSRGFEHDFDKFRGLIGSFLPKLAGPGGQKFKVPGPKP